MAALGIMALLPAAAGAASPARGWTLIDLGTLGGPGSYAAAISDSGHIVGCADLPNGVAHAFIYKDGTMRDLGPASDVATGSSCALAVNNHGVVAGRSTTGELVVWAGSSVQRLGQKGDIGAIDDSGVVVGSYNEGPVRRAFRFANGALTTLGNLGGSGDSHAAAINSRGQIAGTSNGRAFLYQDGTMRDLGTLGGNGSFGKGLNESGYVVGMSADSNGQTHPFIFDGSMHELAAPPFSAAIAINNWGQIIGSAEGSYGYLIDGFHSIRLDTLAPVVQMGWRHLEPTGINDRGWIVGTAVTPSGDLRAFLLIPLGPYSSRPVSR